VIRRRFALVRHQPLVLAVVSFALPVAVFLLLPPALARLLLAPGLRLVSALDLNRKGDFASILMYMGVSWLLLALVTALCIVTLKRTLWRRRVVLIVFVVVLGAIAVVAGRGERNEEYEGIWERGFERSDFYYRGECWRPPLWLVPTPDIHELLSQGQSGALSVRFVGDSTPIGRYGHLGLYLREVRVVRMIGARPAAPCQPSSR
jgi:hypothetical protein